MNPFQSNKGLKYEQLVSISFPGFHLVPHLLGLGPTTSAPTLDSLRLGNLTVSFSEPLAEGEHTSGVDCSWGGL